MGISTGAAGGVRPQPLIQPRYLANKFQSFFKCKEAIELGRVSLHTERL